MRDDAGLAADGHTHCHWSRPRSSLDGAFGFKPPDLGPQFFDPLTLPSLMV
jgi:hypothetical protein